MEVKDLNLIEMEVKENTCQRRIYGIFKYMRIDPSVPDKLDKIGLKTMQRLTESGCISRGSEEELPKSIQTGSLDPSFPPSLDTSLIVITTITATSYPQLRRSVVLNYQQNLRYRTRLGTAWHRPGTTYDSSISTSHLLILNPPSALWRHNQILTQSWPLPREYPTFIRTRLQGA